MDFSITHVLGSMERNPSAEKLASLVAELDTADDEHPDVALSLEDGWSLSVFRNGNVILGNLEDDDEEPVHLRSVSRQRVLVLMNRFAFEGIEAVGGEPWESGYPR